MAVGSSNDFDLVVLGAGTGGYTAAFRAAQLGLRVALVDEDKIGGTCLHRGCIPTKALLESAAFNDRLRHAKDFGLGVGDVTIDYAQMAKRRDQIVTRMWKGVTSLVTKNKVTWVQGRGRLEGGTKVRVLQAGDDGTPGAGGERVLQANDIILATGSRVKSLPGLDPDGRTIVTSDDVLKADTLPKSVIVVGAGAVGVEFASMYHDLGVQVTLLEYLPVIVPLEDRDVSKELQRSFERRGIKVITSNRFDPQSVTRDENGICLMTGPEGKEPRSCGRRSCSSPPGGPPTSRTWGSRPPRPRSSGASSRSTAGSGPASRISTPSATSSAGCSSRIPPRTRASWRPMSSPARRTSTRSTT